MSGIRQQCVLAHVCVSVCPSSFAHPNTSRLITKRESVSGSRGSNSSFHQRRTKEGVFPSSLHLLFLLLVFLSLSFSLSFPPSPLPCSVGRVPQPYSHFPGPWRDTLAHTRAHTSPLLPPSHCAKEGNEKDEGPTLSLSIYLREMTDRSVTWSERRIT